MKDSRFYALISAILLTLTLSACAPYRPGHYKSGVCNQLNSQMVFSGSTSNARQADIQRAEAPMIARSWRKDGCQG